MADTTHLRETTLKKLEEILPELRERFGIEVIGIFGSIARGEGTPQSDIDMYYRISPERVDFNTYLDLCEYLETLFGRKIDLVPLDDMPAYFRKYIEPDMAGAGTV
ncbi:MAG: nucleotidyltransferase family protein [Methanocorpusculum sp.]|nr:nucleotidyltransferase family protein [Methanocorpusculum sp.]